MSFVENKFGSKVRRDYGGYYINDDELDARVDIQSVNSNQSVEMVRGCIYNSVIVLDREKMNSNFLDKVLKVLKQYNEDVEILDYEKVLRVETIVPKVEDVKVDAVKVKNGKPKKPIKEVEKVEKPKSVKVEVEKL